MRSFAIDARFWKGRENGVAARGGNTANREGLLGESEVNSSFRYRFWEQSDDKHQAKALRHRDELQSAISPCSVFLVRLGSLGHRANWSFIGSLLLHQIAMSFIAHEGKVSFECCRPYKGRPGVRASGDLDNSSGPNILLHLIVQKSVPAVRNSPRSPVSLTFLAISQRVERKYSRVRGLPD
jgi:hypothetical protein